MFDGLFKSLISLGKYAANTVVTDQLSKICSPPYFPSVRTIPADGQAAQIALPHMHIVS